MNNNRKRSRRRKTLDCPEILKGSSRSPIGVVTMASGPKLLSSSSEVVADGGRISARMPWRRRRREPGPLAVLFLTVLLPGAASSFVTTTSGRSRAAVFARRRRQQPTAIDEGRRGLDPARQRRRSVPAVRAVNGGGAEDVDRPPTEGEPLQPPLSTDGNREIGDGRPRRQQKSRGPVLTPYHFQYPSYFSYSTSVGEGEGDSGAPPAPLGTAMTSTMTALRRIVDGEECAVNALRVAVREAQDTSELSPSAAAPVTAPAPTAPAPAMVVIRIEHAVSQSVDPLCWLHAQRRRLLLTTGTGGRQATRGGSSSDEDAHDAAVPAVYFADAEGTTETAAIGSCHSLRDLCGDGDDEEIGSSARASGDDDSSWDSIATLPRGSRYYGGARFDASKSGTGTGGASANRPGEEWHEFGDALWILPSVEVRREQRRERVVPGASTSGTSGDTTSKKGTAADDDEVDDVQHSQTTTTTTTFAIHLRGDSVASLTASAARVLSTLQRYSIRDDASPPVPPTTLPPITRREYAYGAEDSQDAFERAICTALEVLGGGNGGGERDGDGEQQQRSSLDDTGSGGTGDGSDGTTAVAAGSGPMPPRLRKVVLARRAELHLAAETVSGLDLLKKLRFGGHVGHLFYLTPDIGGSGEFFGCTPERLFKVQGHRGRVVTEALAGTRPRGSSAEADAELLRDLITSSKDREENILTAEYIGNALDQLRADGLLLNKDDEKMIEADGGDGGGGGEAAEESSPFFVRRLRHLQHICQSFEGHIAEGIAPMAVARSLLRRLHPTPAVGGLPRSSALQFIRRNEGHSFDRGYFAGPFGFLSPDETDVAVAIRSALISSEGGSGRRRDDSTTTTADGGASYHRETASSTGAGAGGAEADEAKANARRVYVYAGAGIVPGSTPEGEWMETSHKLGVMSSLFPASPVTLQSAPTPNVAWSTAFVEELIRSGITQFYICPGSRSTPLTAAIARAATRTRVGEAIQATSVHDERGAAFRALGYARKAGKPAAVITSSGTAVANLYPAVVEAGLDGVPMLLLTADRPYENRDTMANQAIDQVKAYSSSYVRWFRDILPPSDDVPVSACLSDANHAVTVARDLMGPVHINIQFRENLAPEAGKIRNDNRLDAVTRFHPSRFTDVPGFRRWSLGGGSWSQSYYPSESGESTSSSMARSAIDVANLILRSKRGVIVVGGIRCTGTSDTSSDGLNAISHFAQSVGFPVFAGVQSAFLRQSSAVVPFADHVLKHPAVRQNLKPDLILQLGAPLVSTEFSGMIADSMKAAAADGDVKAHVLIHKHRPAERSDPDFTVTHRVSADAAPFLRAVIARLESIAELERVSSELAPLALLGRELEGIMPGIIHKASESIIGEQPINGENGGTGTRAQGQLTEPQVALAVSEVMSERVSRTAQLFLSNSMPVRDAEFFLYPPGDRCNRADASLQAVAVNRGASGIDGIISTAAGFADAAAADSHTTLIIGDLAALHDINALHTLARTTGADHGAGPPTSTSSTNQNSPSLTTVVVNNDGGGIFSFLPIAKHGDTVGFDDFFGTPTNSFSFKKGAEAFGLPFQAATSYESFKTGYRNAVKSGVPNIVEATVVDRQSNVAVHAEITRQTKVALDDIMDLNNNENSSGLKQLHLSKLRLPIKVYRKDELGELAAPTGRPSKTDPGQKCLLLLHGWLGDKEDWDVIASDLIQTLPPDWDIVSVDLPGHGESPLLFSDTTNAIRKALGLNADVLEDRTQLPQHSTEVSGRLPVGGEDHNLSVDAISTSIMHSLKHDYGLNTIDAVCGYSLGGRVALAMARLSRQMEVPLIGQETQMILIGSDPGFLPLTVPGEDLGSKNSAVDTRREDERTERLAKDGALATRLESLSTKSVLDSRESESAQSLRWSPFLSRWYGVKSLWGDFQNERSPRYQGMVKKRAKTLGYRGKDLASILRSCSPPRNSDSDWQFCSPSRTLFVAGSKDKKYSEIGHRWANVSPGTNCIDIPDAGHALLTEAPSRVADIISSFLTKTTIVRKTPSPQTHDTTAPSALKEPFTKSPDSDSSNERTETFVAASSYPSFKIGALRIDYELFAIEMNSNGGRSRGILGIGWGDKAAPKEENKLNERRGYLINLVSSDGAYVGIGEVSPLTGLHEETLSDAQDQLRLLQERFNSMQQQRFPILQPESILSLDGSLSSYLGSLVEAVNDCNHTSTIQLLPSVRAGLEMALLSLAAACCRLPLPQALAEHSQFTEGRSLANLLPLNGMKTRMSSDPFTMAEPGREDQKPVEFPSMKVKVAHQGSGIEDAQAIVNALFSANQFSIDDNKSRRAASRVRADANRAWNQSEALAFVGALDNSDPSIKSSRFEFIEEPLKEQYLTDGEWILARQIEALDDWYQESGMKWALDESLAQAAKQSNYSFQLISEQLRDNLAGKEQTGCAALVLKPALLGLELSMLLARFAHEELGIGAVFSSSFDSGVGLAYTAMLGAVSDASPHATSSNKYPHGVGTFCMLGGDTLSPPFRSYVNGDGMLKVSSLARALCGLGLDELREAFTLDDSDRVRETNTTGSSDIDNYQATASTSSTGREIRVEVSLPLPFSDDIACSRFTDLPQASRWSPWLNSVAYLEDGKETEWTLNVRGVQYRWRAVSTVIDNPKGIMWESVSGLKNKGVVLFMPQSENSCLMKVKMSIITPRLLAPVFRGTASFVEEFLENKLLKWSLEMFRDVVKADLALERGDAELGDALFGAVEGKANAIEATLSYAPSTDSFDGKRS